MFMEQKLLGEVDSSRDLVTLFRLVPIDMQVLVDITLVQ